MNDNRLTDELNTNKKSTKTKMISTYVECATYNDGSLWFISGDLPCLYCMDVNTGKVEKIFQLTTYEEKTPYLYYSIIYLNDFIYMIPWKARSLAIFNVAKREIEYIDIPKKYLDFQFCGTVTTEKYIFSFCIQIPVIMRINIINKHIDFYELNINVDKLTVDNSFCLSGLAVVIDDNLFFTLRNKKAVIQMNCDNFMFCIHELVGVEGTYFGIEYSNEIFYCSPEHIGEPILILDKEFLIKKKIDTWGSEKNPLGIYLSGDSIFVYSLDESFESQNVVWEKYHHFITRFNNGILAFNRERDTIRIRLHDGRVFTNQIYIPYEKESLKIIASLNYIVDGNISLSDFIESIL